jgi:hypothetical protein
MSETPRKSARLDLEERPPTPNRETDIDRLARRRKRAFVQRITFA